jgi:hypothetical protein
MHIKYIVFQFIFFYFTLAHNQKYKPYRTKFKTKKIDFNTINNKFSDNYYSRQKLEKPLRFKAQPLKTNKLGRNKKKS